MKEHTKSCKRKEEKKYIKRSTKIIALPGQHLEVELEIITGKDWPWRCRIFLEQNKLYIYTCIFHILT